MPRLTLTREFFIPRPELGAVVTTGADDCATVYTWTEAGKICAKGFRGAVAKPAFHYTYRTVEQRAAHVSKFIGDAEAAAQLRAKQAAEARWRKASLNAVTGMPIGTLLVNSWGYEQTNVDFYQVVGHQGRVTVRVVAIGAKRVEEATSGAMADTCTPDLDAPTTGETFTARMVDQDTITLPNSRHHASRWSGRAMHRSWYA